MFLDQMPKETSKEKLSKLVKDLSDDESKSLIKIIKNKQTLGLLEREAEWLSTHHQAGDYCKSHERHGNPNHCQSSYSGDTISDFESRVHTLILKLFELEAYE